MWSIVDPCSRILELKAHSWSPIQLLQIATKYSLFAWETLGAAISTLISNFITGYTCKILSKASLGEESWRIYQIDGVRCYGWWRATTRYIVDICLSVKAQVKESRLFWELWWQSSFFQQLVWSYATIVKWWVISKRRRQYDLLSFLSYCFRDIIVKRSRRGGVWYNSIVIRIIRCLPRKGLRCFIRRRSKSRGRYGL